MNEPVLPRTYSIPGKVFILGEYLALAGGGALIATVPPRFQMVVSASQLNPVLSKLNHPESPISRLNEWAQKQNYPDFHFTFTDPLEGAGGFGASTAEFGMAYLAYCIQNGYERFGHYGPLEKEASDWRKVWSLYRHLMMDEQLIPSGADLVAQWQGGVCVVNPFEGTCEAVWSQFNWSNLLVFSATSQKGRKVPTHEHLRRLAQLGHFGQFGQFGLMSSSTSSSTGNDFLASLQRILIHGTTGISNHNPLQLGESMDQYSEVLQKAGLEIPETQADRLELRKLPGVLGVKGAGALQSDAILVLSTSEKAVHEQIIRVAQRRGLTLVADGLSLQQGIQLEEIK